MTDADSPRVEVRRFDDLTRGLANRLTAFVKVSAEAKDGTEAFAEKVTQLQHSLGRSIREAMPELDADRNRAVLAARDLAHVLESFARVLEEKDQS